MITHEVSRDIELRLSLSIKILPSYKFYSPVGSPPSPVLRGDKQQQVESPVMF